MFGPSVYESSPYLFNPDEAYSTNMDFDKLIFFLKEIAKEKNFDTDECILIIELPEGVFIRSQTTEWCDFLTAFSRMSVEGLEFNIIGEQKWTELTKKYRDPIKLFGDNKLARWRFGF